MKKLLIVVDYQNDFVNGTLGFPGAELLDEVICSKISDYKMHGHDVIYTGGLYYGRFLYRTINK